MDNALHSDSSRGHGDGRAHHQTDLQLPPHAIVWKLVLKNVGTIPASVKIEENRATLTTPEGVSPLQSLGPIGDTRTYLMPDQTINLFGQYTEVRVLFRYGRCRKGSWCSIYMSLVNLNVGRLVLLWSTMGQLQQLEHFAIAFRFTETPTKKSLEFRFKTDQYGKISSAWRRRCQDLLQTREGIRERKPKASLVSM